MFIRTEQLLKDPKAAQKFNIYVSNKKKLQTSFVTNVQPTTSQVDSPYQRKRKHLQSKNSIELGPRLEGFDSREQSFIESGNESPMVSPPQRKMGK